jgi:hypothetical protein
VCEGMKLARSLNFTKVEVRIDSIEVVNVIMQKKPSRMCGKALIDKICELLVFD